MVELVALYRKPADPAAFDKAYLKTHIPFVKKITNPGRNRMNRTRTALVNRLEQSGKDYVAYISRLTDEEIHAPAAPGEWTIHQLVVHMRDTEEHVFVERTQRILKETHPAVLNFDQDEWNREHYSPTEPFQKVVADFRSLRRRFIRLLRRASEKDWDNWAMHSEYKKISLDWLAMHSYHHTLEHIAQIGALREKVLLEELNE